MRTPTRALAVLIGAAAAGALIWFAGRFDRPTSHDYWISLGLVAAAGLVLGFAQRAQAMPAGGLLVSLAVMIVTVWVAIAVQPSSGDVSRWSHDIGIARVVNDLGVHVGVLAFGTGVVLGSVAGLVRIRRRAALHAAAPDEVAAEDRLPEPSVHAVP